MAASLGTGTSSVVITCVGIIKDVEDASAGGGGCSCLPAIECDVALDVFDSVDGSVDDCFSL